MPVSDIYIYIYRERERERERVGLEASLFGTPLICDFYKEVFSRCPNAKVPTVKLTEALMKLHEQKSILTTVEHAASWIPTAGVVLGQV